MTQDSSDETQCLKSWEKDEKDPDIIPLNKLMHWTFPFTKKSYEKFTNTQRFVANFHSENRISSTNSLSSQIFRVAGRLYEGTCQMRKFSGWHKELGWNEEFAPWKVTF